MSIISLTVAPLFRNKEDWQEWYYGLIPLAIMIIGTIVIYRLFWGDSLDLSMDVGGEPAKDVESVGEDPVKEAA